jgi:hypothetical protein
MKTVEIIEKATADGVSLVLSPTGKIMATGDQLAVDKWLLTIRRNKPDILLELLREQRHTTVRALLVDQPYAVMVEDDSTDPVIATVGIRDLATFEMVIPKHFFNGMVLAELIEKYSGDES